MSDFVDVARIQVRSGRGGDGCVSLRREKFVPRGGPDGGDGGKGGDVIVRVNPHMRTLLDFTYRTSFRAESGKHGSGATKTGRGGADCIIEVPPGTVIFDEATGEQVADLVGVGYEFIAARGGRGGRGNARFATSTRQTPRYAEKGEPGREVQLRLELKLLADVGVIGFPNVGKSSLITRISAARPKVANYHFTTLSPNLGVVTLPNERQMVVADMPGLVPGAHSGVGLGHQFLRHVERTSVLLHMLDAGGMEGRDPLEDFAVINSELTLYSEHLAQLPQLVALNKVDLISDRKQLQAFSEALKAQGYDSIAVSAATGEGLNELLERTWELLATAGGPAVLAERPEERIVYEMPPQPETATEVIKLDEGVFSVRGTTVEKMIEATDMRNPAAIEWLHEKLDRIGILERLESLGAEEGDTVFLGEFETEYRLDMGR